MSQLVKILTIFFYITIHLPPHSSRIKQPKPKMEFKYTLTAPAAYTKETVRCLLSTILFHRMLGPASPSRHEILGGRLSYPAVVDAGAVEIEEKVNAADLLVRKALGTAAPKNNSNAYDSTVAGSGLMSASAVRVSSSSPSESPLVATIVLKVRFLGAQDQLPRAKSWFRQGDGSRCWESWQITISFTQTLPLSAAVTTASASPSRTSPRRSSGSSNSGGGGTGGTAGTGASMTASTKALVRDLKAIMLEILKNASQSYIPAITSPDVAPFPYEISVTLASSSNNNDNSGGAPSGNDWGSVIKKILD